MGNTEASKWKLIAMFSLNFTYFLVELVVGYLTHSMALVADSFHMLSDVVALCVAYFAVKMSPKKWSKNTYGWARAEVLGALVNAVFLLALCFSIVVEAIQRIFEPRELKDPNLILIVGSIGLVMNLVGLCIFRDHGHSHSHGHSHGQSHHHAHGDRGISPERRRSGLAHSNRLTRLVSSMEPEDTEDEDNSSTRTPYEHHVLQGNSGATTKLTSSNNNVAINVEDSNAERQDKDRNGIVFKSKEDMKTSGNAGQMNIKGVFLHILADAMGSVVVIVSALIVEFTDWKYEMYIDPAMSIFMVILILASVYPLLIESSLILLQSVPSHINLEQLEKNLLKQIDGVMGIHELHVWQLAGDRIIATVHIKCRTLEEYFYIAEKVKAVFHNEGIHSTTIQPEFCEQSPENLHKLNVDCFLSCSALSTDTYCSKSTCCPNRNRIISTRAEEDKCNHNET